MLSVTFILTEEDHREAVAPVIRARLRERGLLRWRNWPAALLVLAFIIWLSVRRGRDGIWFALFMIALVTVLSFAVSKAIHWVMVRRAPRFEPEAGPRSQPRRLTIEISDRGVTWESPPKFEPWTTYSHYLELDNYFVLCRSGSIHAILPKRAFAVENIETFRQILLNHLKALPAG